MGNNVSDCCCQKRFRSDEVSNDGSLKQLRGTKSRIYELQVKFTVWFIPFWNDSLISYSSKTVIDVFFQASPIRNRFTFGNLRDERTEVPLPGTSMTRDGYDGLIG